MRTAAKIDRRKPTERQKDLVVLLRGFLKLNGYSPTLREMAGLAGASVNNVAEQLERLRTKGLVTWERGKIRTLRPVP